MIVTVSWDPNPADQLITSYKVYQSKNGQPFALVGTVQAPATSLSMTDPVPGQYQWKVSAVNLAGEGAQSVAVDGPSLPTVPTNVQITVS